VDRLSEELAGMGYTDFLVEVGGEVRARGRNARGTLWRVAVLRPTADGGEFEQIVAINNMSLTTAGDYRNYTERDGRRICHIVDPHTGQPVTHRLASVSVLHEKCVMADGYDTALMVLGPDEGYALAVKEGLAALFIVHDPTQGFDTRATPAYERLTRATE